VTSLGGTTTYDREAHPGPVAPHSPLSGPGPATVEEQPRSIGAAQPTGVEGTPEQAGLDHLAALAHQAVAAWRSWRTSMRGDVPGRALMRAAAARHGSAPITQAERTYLASRLGGDEGMSLRELVRFDGGPSSMAVAELFGLAPATAIPHRYHLVISGQGGRAGGIVGGAVRIQQMVITYQNELGMHFRRELTGVSGSLTGQPSGSGTRRARRRARQRSRPRRHPAPVSDRPRDRRRHARPHAGDLPAADARCRVQDDQPPPPPPPT
jgi:hypothetical protein